MKQSRIHAAVIAAGLMVAGAQASAEDCTLGERYFKRAEAAQAAYDDESRIRNLQLAAQACNDSAIWLELGDAIMEIRDAAEPWLGVDAEDAEDGFAIRASDAYSRANEYAATPAAAAAAGVAAGVPVGAASGWRGGGGREGERGREEARGGRTLSGW